MNKNVFKIVALLVVGSVAKSLFAEPIVYNNYTTPAEISVDVPKKGHKA